MAVGQVAQKHCIDGRRQPGDAAVGHHEVANASTVVTAEVVSPHVVGDGRIIGRKRQGVQGAGGTAASSAPIVVVKRIVAILVVSFASRRQMLLADQKGVAQSVGNISETGVV